jgi:DNA polymerase delta subunit 4
MAPKRRSSTQAASSQRNQQATIAFGKQGLNKVTKNATQHSAKSSKKEAALVNLLSDDEITVDTTSIAEKQQAKVEPVESKPCTQELSEEETRARNMTDAQIKTYWRNKEAERKAPRVHQQALDVTEKMLREFDMSNQYGVS